MRQPPPHRRRAPALLALLLAAGGMAHAGCAKIERVSGHTERQANLARLERLKVGMTQDEVLAVMGRPLTDEKYHRPDVWWYYTDWDWADGVRTSTECTPLVFEQGKLAGWGSNFYKKHRQKDWR